MNSADTLAHLTRSGLNLIAQAISIFDADLRLAVCNRPYAEMFDLPPSLTQRGAAFEDTVRYLARRGEYGVIGDLEETVRNRVKQARAFQPHYVERQRADGRHVSVEGAPLAEGGWIAVYTDITEIRTQESLLRARASDAGARTIAHAERLAAANRALAATNAALAEAQRTALENEKRIRQITEMLPAHIAHMDRDYRYTFTNRQASAVFPGASKHIIGQTGDEVLGKAAFDTIRPRMAAALTGDPQVFEMTDPNSGRRIRIALTPDGTGEGAFILSTDVTAEVQAREAITQASRRAVAAQMTSGMAHDFGNLLTIIIGMQHRLMQSALPAEAREDVAATISAARRGVTLLARINDITTSAPAAMQPLGLKQHLRSLARLAARSLGAGITLRLTLDLPDEQLLLDGGGLQDALLNLLLNARDAMEGHGEILLSAEIRGDWVHIRVTDKGPGFTPEALKEAMHPFFTTKGRQGSGLGLAMVFDHVKLAGGSVRFGNHAEGGGVVSLRLPRRIVEPQMILLAEDDPDQRSAMRDRLTDLGHAVIEAENYAEALQMLDIQGLDIVLSDLQLGDGSGADLRDALTPGGPRLIVMTALPETAEARCNLDLPMLSKPVSDGALTQALRPVQPS